jgi:hypothetical protein
MNFKFIIGAACFCGVSLNVNANLIERLGGEAYYDTGLDITWLADANYAQTSGFDPAGCMSWEDANTWAVNLNISGITGWRLPSLDVNGDGTIINCSGGGVANCDDNEMGYLFYEEGIKSSAQGVFSNVQNEDYWSSTESNFAGFSEVFHFGGGSQNENPNGDYNFAWAVYSGDVGNVSTVPVPAAAWLFGSGLVGLVGLAKRKT